MFCKILNKLRKEQAITQDHLADLLNVSRTTIVRYEKGICEPDISTLVKIADIFNVSLDYLLGRTDNKYNISMMSKYNQDVFIQISDILHQYDFSKK
ncbi:helix-turn-helix domain-containing protein [Clostridium butyricum]